MKVSKYIPLLFILVSLLLCGWGKVGHAIINYGGAEYLPSSMQGLIDRSQMMSDSSSNADNRKNVDPSESPKHFLDIDAYPEFASKSVIQNYDSLVAKYGSSTVLKNGTLPWAIVAAMDSLTAQFQRQNWTRAWSTAADLGHYVGDAHQPLHATQYYDGKTTYPGSNGVHSRYETTMLGKYQSSITVTAYSIDSIKNPLATAFNILYKSNTYVDSIYFADSLARITTGSNSSTAYYSSLWSNVGGFTKQQIQNAAQMYGSYLYTAWLNAGSPTLPLITSVNPPATSPEFFALDQNYPNPFNPSTVIHYTLSSPSMIFITCI